MKPISSLAEKDLQNKTCLLRVDLNIQKSQINTSISADKRRKNQHKSVHKISAHPRILAILPMIKFLTDNGAKVVILSHRGRPDTKSYNLKVENHTLKPFAKSLSFLLKKPVNFINFDKKAGFVGIKDAQKIRASEAGSVFLIENVRFLSGEEKNDKDLAKKLASLGDIYVNDAFAVSHRFNASLVAITKFIKSYAGLLLEKEIKNLKKAMEKPKKPLVVILGGAKVFDKIGLIENFQKKADYFLIGGGMANTFLASSGLPVGDSLYDKNVNTKKLIKNLRHKIILPVDFVIQKRKILDIGPETIEKYSKIIKNAKTVIWNGPMGYIEDEKFRQGSEAIAEAIANSDSFSIVGGGETVSILKTKKHNKNTNVFISTGGGAMLEYLAGKKLPGIEALN